MNSKPHWEQVYRQHDANVVSWYQPHAEASLRLIGATGMAKDAPLIDVGGGASTLVDDLLDSGHSALTVLDLAGAALQQARERLAARAAAVHWIEADITHAELPERGYALWHDRAVFHFLTAEADRAAYLAQLRRALRPGGALVMATFALDGPAECSALPVRRYSAVTLAAELGPEFSLRHAERQMHPTPSGASQAFTCCWFERLPVP